LMVVMGMMFVGMGEGKTWYISPTGSSSGPGNYTNPFQTFAQAYAKVTTGDTITALSGTYVSAEEITSEIKLAITFSSDAGSDSAFFQKAAFTVAVKGVFFKGINFVSVNKTAAVTIKFGSLNISDCSFQNNFVGISVVSGKLTLSECEFEHNALFDIFSEDSVLAVSHAVFTGNTLTGTAIGSTKNSYLAVTDVDIEQYDIAMDVQNSSMLLSDSRVSNNSFGVLDKSGSLIVVVDTTFANNSISGDFTNSTGVNINTTLFEGGGAALLFNGCLKVTLTDCTLKNFTSSAVSNLQSRSILSFTNVDIENSKTSDYGGAIFLSAQTSLILKSGSLTNNHAKQSGGAIYISGSSELLAYDTSFVDNRAVVSGGAYDCDSTGMVFFSDCSFSGNVPTTASCHNASSVFSR